MCGNIIQGLPVLGEFSSGVDPRATCVGRPLIPKAWETTLSYLSDPMQLQMRTQMLRHPLRLSLQKQNRCHM